MGAASKIITHDRIAEEGAVRDYIGKEFNDFAVITLPAAEEALAKFAKVLQKTTNSMKLPINLDELNAYEKHLQIISKTEIANEKVQQAKLATAAKQEAANKRAIKDAEDQAKSEARLSKEQEKSIGTINLLKKANSDLTKERNKLDLATTEGKLRLEEINKTLDKNNAYIKLNSSALEKQRLDIGGYKDAILEASGAGRLFGGIFGEMGTKLRALGVILTGVRDQLKTNAEVTAENTAATTVNTEAEELNSAAAEANTVAGEANTVVAEAETVATEKLTLAKRAYNAVTSATGLILLAAAAAAKVLYDNLTKTQEQRDSAERTKQAAEAAAGALTTEAQNIEKIWQATILLNMEEKRLADLKISQLAILQKLRTEAAEARLQAEEEGKTTKDKVEALDTYITKLKEVSRIEEAYADIEIDMAQKRLAIDVLKGDPNNREDKQKLEEARAAKLKVEEEDARELLRATKRRTGFIEKDEEDKRKALQESNMRKVELIQDSSKREIKVENEKYKESLSNLKKENEKSGFVNKDFYAEEQSLLKLHLLKIEEIEEKERQKIAKIQQQIIEENYSFEIKQKERQIKDVGKDNFGGLLRKKDDPLRDIEIKKHLNVELLKLQKDAANQKEKQEEIDANNTIDNKEELNKKIELLQLKLNDDLESFDEDQLEKQKALDKEKLDILKKRLKEELDTTADFADKSLKRKNDLKEEELKNDLDSRQRSILQQQQLAAEGLDNTLAFQQAAAAKDELAQQQIAIKKEKQAKEIALFKLLASAADSSDPSAALVKAFTAMGIAEAVAGSYEEGTVDTGGRGKGVDNKGGKLAIIHEHERIMDKENNALTGGMSNDDLAKLAYRYQMGWLPEYDSNGVLTNSNNDEVLKEIKGLRDDIKSRPVSTTNIHKDGTVSKELLANGLKKVIQYKPSNNNYI